MEKGNGITGKQLQELSKITDEQILQVARKQHMKYMKPKPKDESEYSGLDTFPKPDNCLSVTLTSDEVTSLCPITQQPDWYTVRIEYVPLEKCIESKSLKLFFHSLRNEGLFCEHLADKVLLEVIKACDPSFCHVTVVQKSRGGISIESVSEHTKGD